MAETELPFLARYMRSTALGIGDCYWLESLAFAIEAFGQTPWQRVF